MSGRSVAGSHICGLFRVGLRRFGMLRRQNVDLMTVEGGKQGLIIPKDYDLQIHKSRRPLFGRVCGILSSFWLLSWTGPYRVKRPGPAEASIYLILSTE